MTPIKLILVDDHAVVRSGLRRLLELNKCIDVIAEADCGEQAYQRYGELQSDIIVMDISMPGMGGLESARRIIQRYPAAKISSPSQSAICRRFKASACMPSSSSPGSSS